MTISATTISVCLIGAIIESIFVVVTKDYSKRESVEFSVFVISMVRKIAILRC